VDIAQRLRQLEVFGHFSSEQIEQLARCTSRVRYPQDAVVIQEGDHTLDAYVIDSGLVAIQRSTPYGLFSLAQLGAGCELVLVQLYDPLEVAAPPPGLYPVSDGARRGVLDTVGAAHREAWQRRFSDRVGLLEELTRRHRAHLLGLPSDAPLVDTLARGLHPRRNGGGR